MCIPTNPTSDSDAATDVDRPAPDNFLLSNNVRIDRLAHHPDLLPGSSLNGPRITVQAVRAMPRQIYGLTQMVVPCLLGWSHFATTRFVESHRSRRRFDGHL